MKQLRRCRWLASLALAAILCGCYTTYSVPFRGEQKNVEKRHLADAPPDVSVDNLRVNYDAHPPEIACSLGGKMEESWEERPVFEAVHTRHGRMYGDVAVFQNVKKLHESYRPFQITRWFWGHDYEFWATTKGGAYPLFPLTRAHRAAVDPAAALKGFGSFPIASSVWEGKKHLFPVMGDGDLESPVFPMTVSNEWVNSIGQLFMDIIGAACTIGIGVLTTISGAANGDPTAKKALLAPFAMILCPVADVGIHVGDFALFAVAGIVDLSRAIAVPTADGVFLAGTGAADAFGTGGVTAFDAFVTGVSYAGAGISDFFCAVATILLPLHTETAVEKTGDEIQGTWQPRHERREYQRVAEYKDISDTDLKPVSGQGPLSILLTPFGAPLTDPQAAPQSDVTVKIVRTSDNTVVTSVAVSVDKAKLKKALSATSGQ